MLCWILAFVITQPAFVRAADIEPVLTVTDAVAGLPLVLPVRVVGSGTPRQSVTLRFPDGQEIAGQVAAIRLRATEGRADGWLPAGAEWEVIRPADAIQLGDRVAWFVLADLPRGAVGQEVWLDGRPVTLRWLSRPELLALRLGFDVSGRSGSPTTDPWASPVPAEWRSRSDLLTELDSAAVDPVRAWRVRLAAEGLHPRDDADAVAITPDLLNQEILDAANAVKPLEQRLIEAVRDQTEARWRVALARLWAADASLSIRVRHALAGCAAFSFGGSGQVVAPVWTADDAQSAALLEILLDERASLSDRAERTTRWLAALPDAALWTIDDGAGSEAATVAAMQFEAGDAAAIRMDAGARIGRPEILPTRVMRTLRVGVLAEPGKPDGGAVFRIGGTNRIARFNRDAARLEPPGLETGPLGEDWTMARFIASARDARLVNPEALVVAPSMVVTADPGRFGERPRVRLVLRLPTVGVGANWEARLWLGPMGQTRAVVVITGEGDASVEGLAEAGDKVPLPTIERGIDSGAQVVEIVLPESAAGAGGLTLLGIEVVAETGARFAWPRRMMPWQIEPARRAIDPSAWFGGLGE